MSKNLKRLTALILLAALICLCTVPALAAEEPEAAAEAVAEASVSSSKAIAAGILIAVAAGAGAIGMALAIGKSSESIARQPESAGNIRSTLMLGLVFIETAVIYALIVAILIIFVL